MSVAFENLITVEDVNRETNTEANNDGSDIESDAGQQHFISLSTNKYKLGR